MMSFKHKITSWLLFLCFLGTLNVMAAPISILTSTTGIDPVVGGCNWPAPVNFHITGITPTSISVAWNTPINLPPAYNIRATELSSGNVVYSQNIGGMETTWTVPGLLPGVTYIIRNTPVCEDGSMSPNYVEGVGTTTIVDLITVSFSPNDGSVSCIMDHDEEFCYADPDGGYLVPFSIENTSDGYFRYFSIYLATEGCPTTSIGEREEDHGSPFQFYDDNGKAIIITDNGDQVARLLVQTDDTNTKALLVESMENTKHVINRFGPFTGQQYQIGVCDDGSSGSGKKPQAQVGNTAPLHLTLLQGRGQLSAAPNPFDQYLDIALPVGTQTDTKITLFSSHGRQVFQQIFLAGEGSVRLETGSLTPGFYFLQAESAELSETIKVIKTR